MFERLVCAVVRTLPKEKNPDAHRARILAFNHRLIGCEQKTTLNPKRIGFSVTLSMGYKKDIFAVFAYEFELLQN